VLRQYFLVWLGYVRCYRGLMLERSMVLGIGEWVGERERLDGKEGEMARGNVDVAWSL
jgi:hypothetical protein